MSKNIEIIVNNIKEKSNDLLTYIKNHSGDIVKFAKVTGCTFLAAANMLYGAACSETKINDIEDTSANNIPAETTSLESSTNITSSMIIEYADRLATDLARDKYDNIVSAKFKAIMPNCILVNGEKNALRYTSPIEEFVPEYTNDENMDKIRDVCLVSILADVNTTDRTFEDRFINVAINTEVLKDVMKDLGINEDILSESLANSMGCYDPNDLNYIIYIFDEISLEDIINMYHANDSIYNALLSAYGINILGKNFHEIGGAELDK